MTCDVTIERLDAYAAGGEPGLHEHVLDCQICQDRLAVLWSAAPDVAEKTMRAVRADAYVRESLELAGQLVSDFVQAAAYLTFGLRKDQR